MTFGIITINHGRPSILSIWCAGINRLRNEIGEYIPAVVVSGEEDRAICKHYHVEHIIQRNNPATEKFNRGMAYMRSLGIDYVLISGSDNVFSTDTIRRIMAEADKGYDLIGIQDIYFYSTDGVTRGEMVHFNSKHILGVGKTISAKILDKIDWRPWTAPKNWGMDAMVTMAIRPHVQTTKIVENAECFDLKGRDNINKFSMWGRKIKKREDPQKLYGIMSKEELEILNKI